jgi:hypothetical protein
MNRMTEFLAPQARAMNWWWWTTLRAERESV